MVFTGRFLQKKTHEDSGITALRNILILISFNSKFQVSMSAVGRPDYVTQIDSVGTEGARPSKKKRV